MTRLLYLTLWIAVLIPGFSCAQIAVSNTNSASVLAQKLVGPGVYISNPSILCNGNQSGLFTVTSSNLGVDSGIVLTTGVAASVGLVNGVNGLQSAFANANQGTGGDADLTTLAGISTYDRCVLEFDLKADGDSIVFKYIFGSEEYPAFNCTNYNDVFGFFISGPGYPSPQNIALVPGTAIPVAINSVNNGVISAGGNLSNCTAMGSGSPFTGYYVDNTGGTSVTYDGFTQLFTARAGIQKCSTYHLKLAIADGFDHIFDSGVFLQAGSLQSNHVNLSVQLDSMGNGVPMVFEACDSAIVKIHRHLVQTSVTTDTVQLLISGTSTNGVDYPLIASTYIFSNSISDTLRTIYIEPFNDLITEGTETLKLVLVDKCLTPVDSLTIEIKDPPKFTLTNNDTLICRGQSVSSNGVYDNGLVFSWSPTTGVSNPTSFYTTFTPTTTTQYTLTATYGNCEPIFDSIKITVEPLPTLTVTSTNILCNGLNNGSLTATTSVGSLPLSIGIIPSPSTQFSSPATFANLSAGIYTVTATSGLGCTKTATKSITEPPLLTWANATAVNIGCNSVNTGQIQTHTAGGNGAITYTLTPGNVSNATGNYSALAPGTYSVTAKDANNCSITTSFTITQASGLALAAVVSTPIPCFGNNIGVIQTLASGGTGIINFTLTPGNVVNTTGNYTGLGAGSYTISAVDANGCSGSTLATLTQPTALGFLSVTPTNLLCNGLSNGTITATSSGGTPTINYTLNPGSISNTTGAFSALTAGTFTISMVDANGCSVTQTSTITQPSPIVISGITKVNPSCIPGNNGSITVAASGGSGTLTYQLNGGAFQSGNLFGALSPGAYTITIKDANGCTVTSTAGLNFTNVPVITNTSPFLPCATTTGPITVTASNGTAPYTYTLNPGSITNNTGIMGNGVFGTSYTVTVVDANGCSSSKIIALIYPPIMTWASFTKTNIPCNGIGTGGINCTATGGTGVITYQLLPPNTTNTTGTFTNLTVGSYTVIATDANGCTITNNASIIVSPTFTLNPVVTAVSCNGLNNGSVAIGTTGGTGTKTYTLSPGALSNTSGNFSSLTPGVYTVSVIDGAACTNSVTFTMTQPAVLAIANVNKNVPSCNPGSNGTLKVVATGGNTPYSFSSDGSIFQVSDTLQNLSNQTYTIVVKDSKGCTATSVVNMVNSNALSIVSTTVQQASCAGGSTGSVTVVSTGGSGAINFSINPLSLTNTTGVFLNLPINNYIVTVSDAVGCTKTTAANIIPPSQITWDTTYAVNVLCNGQGNGEIHAHAGGGNGTLNYVLMPGNITNTSGDFGPLSQATYTVTASDAIGCSLSTTLTISNPPTLLWNAPTSSNIICNGTPTGTITANTTGGTGTITYTANPGAITNTNGLFTNLVAATYTVQALDANGCSISSIFPITQAPIFNFVSVSNTIPTCVPGNNASITVLVTGGLTPYQYNLNGGANQSATTFNGIGVSTYTIQATDGTGCSITSVLTVSNPASPNISSVNTVNVLCFGNNTGTIQTLASGGTGALTYTLSPTATSNSTGNFINLFANNYTVSVTDASGCGATSNIILTQPPLLLWDSVNHRDISCYGGSNGLVASSASGGNGTITYQLLPSGATNFSGAFFGLAMGNYTINATDQNGCMVTATFYINQAPPINWNTSSTIPASCFGGNNGSLSITASGGVGGFNYKLLPGAIVNTSGTFTGLSAGIYTVVVTDANSCTKTTAITVDQANQVILINTATTFASCAPGCDGTAAFTAGGGNGVYTFSVNGGTSYQASNLFTGICTGVYTVMIKDGNNCTGSGTYNISTATGPNQITASITNVACQGGSNGVAIISATGGTGAMNYKLLPSTITNSTGIFSGLTAASYSIIATDATGCTISTVIQVTQPTTLQLNTPTLVNPSCFGGTNGVITITSSGGSGGVNYQILPGGQSNALGIFAGLGANTFTITATDVNACTATMTVVMTTPLQLVSNVTSQTPVSCFGGNNGSANISSAGGTGAVSYQLMPGNIVSSAGSFSGLTAGSYTITATDANLCTSSTIATIGTPTALSITQLSATIPTCVPGADAVLTTVANGATLPYSYNVNGGAFQASGVFSNLSIGAYTVQVKDANGCSVTSTISIVNPVSPIINSIAMTQAGCNPGCDGGLTITSSNGTGAHTYSINGGPFQSSTIFNNLCAATYTVTVKDASGCTVTSSISVTTLPGPIVTNAAITNVLCNGGNNGSLFLSVSGGTGLITYVMQPGNLTSTTASWNNLSAGSYTIVGTDSKGCSTSTLAIISQPVSLSFGPITTQQPTCFGNDNGQITAPALGGVAPYSYSILPSGTFVAPNTFIGLLGNVNYTITVTDGNACSLTTVVNLGQPSQVAITSMSTTPVTCYGQSNGTLNAVANGGTGTIQFLLMPGNQNNTSGNFINLPGNNYTVTASDANGCTKTSSAFIFEPTDIVINSAIATDIICFGQTNGTVNVSASGGMPTLNYLLMPGAVTSSTGSYSNLSATTYTVIVTDNNGCTESVTKIVNEPALVQISSVSPTQVKCFGNSDGTITATGSGGVGQLTYLLMPGNVTNNNGVFTGLPVNTYTITLTDANNCSASTTVTLTQPTPLNLLLDSLHNVTCHGGNDGFIHASTTGGTLPYLYTMYPNGINSSIGDYNSLFAGSYMLTVTDNNGCKDTLSNLPIIEPAAIIYTNVAHQDITCYQDSSGTITVAAMGGNGSLQHSIAPAGAGIQNPAGYFYGLTGGTYTITTTDAKGCTISTAITILQNLEVSLDVTFTEPVCYGEANGSIEIVATGGTAPLSFSLDNAAFTQATLFANLSAGTHTIVTMDAKSCISDTMLVLTEPDKVGAIVDLSNAKCNTLNDGYIHASGFGGRNNFTYYLKPGLYVNKTGIFNDLKISTYTLVVKDSSGCIFDTVLVVNPPEDPLAVAITSQNIGCYGVGTEGWAEANPAGGQSPYIYLWNVTPAQTSKRLENLRYGYYAVEVTDAQGCTASDSVYIEPGPCCDEIFIPNAFSPNNDGKNDIWRITTAAGIELIQLEVYDRWGNRVWGTLDPLQGWNGLFKGKEMDVETYFYLLRYTCLVTGQKLMKSGDVILIR